MKTKIKFSVLFFVGLLFFTGCDNSKTRTDIEKTDSTKMTDMENDSMDKINSGEMPKVDNGLMTAMNAMMDKMSNMKMSGDIDLDFANMMVEHHQGAIDMSNIELAKGTDEKIKSMAQNIITKQTEEISMLKVVINNFKKSGMKHGEGDLQKIHTEMKTEMSAMQMTDNTDKDYARMMISHHESAVKMFKSQVSNGMNDELKKMAKKGITDQAKEIAEFKAWLSENK